MSKELAKRFTTAGCAFLFALASPIYTLAQAPSPSFPQSPTQTRPPVQSRHARAANPMDDFADLQLTDDQKAKMRRIQDEFRSRLNAVANDKTLDVDQKNAFLQGFQRLEYREIYTDVLSSEQQSAVRKKASERHAGERQASQKQPAPN